MAQKDLFVNAIEMLEFGQESCIPTAIAYAEGSSPAIGYEADSRARGVRSNQQEFKIALGNIKPGGAVTKRTKFTSGDGKQRSAYEITKNFYDILLSQACDSLREKSLKPAKQAIVSEPLSFYKDDNEDWLANYRANLRRILSDKFDVVDFLPEPFAVYQYYRYGLKHPLVGEEKKTFALVVDFGGGTFDVSIVESTKSGDISKKGRHAKPIAAHSKPFGGFAINRLLAEHIVMSCIEGSATREATKKCLANHERNRTGALDISGLSSRNQRFIRWYDQFLNQVESLKLEVSRSIANWKLDAPLSQRFELEMPEDPFDENSRNITRWLSAKELREIFIDEIWQKKLKATIAAALKIAAEVIGENKIHIVLLSGGSSNFQWLANLLTRDFSRNLGDARLVSLQESYQEVVAKGLAIECARRGYEEESEFSDITYNPLFLVLDPDGKGEERRKFGLIESSIDVDEPTVDAQLLSAASRLEGGNIKFRWRVKLGSPPKQRLQYYFLRNPDDINDLESRYNFVESEVHTKKGTTFDSRLKLDLEICVDGTCRPTFVYKTGKENAVIHSSSCEPFHIDFVAAEGSPKRSAYLGIDFGTSTSAISYIDWGHVEQITKRRKEQQWRKLNELLDLPHPASVPIKRLLADVQDGQFLTSLEALESLMAFTVFAIWADVYSAPNSKKCKMFGANYKRSAGQLKANLIQIRDAKVKSGFAQRACSALKKIPEDKLNDAVNSLDAEKHQKKEPGSFDPRPIIEELGNSLLSGLNDYKFGFFESVKKEGFGEQHTGVFRVAHGSQPFHEKLAYTGSRSFSREEAFLVSSSEGIALSLTPLMYWQHEYKGGGAVSSRCFFYDGISRAKEYEFKQCGGYATEKISDGPLKDCIDALVSGDFEPAKYDSLTLIGDEN